MHFFCLTLRRMLWCFSSSRSLLLLILLFLFIYLPYFFLYFYPTQRSCFLSAGANARRVIPFGISSPVWLQLALSQQIWFSLSTVVWFNWGEIPAQSPEDHPNLSLQGRLTTFWQERKGSLCCSLARLGSCFLFFFFFLPPQAARPLDAPFKLWAGFVGT